MRRTSGAHWIGVLFLFIASILLLIVTISAPIIHNVGILRLANMQSAKNHQESISFGTFGWCRTGPDGLRLCSGRHLGYHLSEVVSNLDNSNISYVAGGTTDALIYVMVLHPIACGIAFIAFLVSIGGGVVASLAGSAVASFAFLLTLVAMACDFSAFGIVRKHINDDNSPWQANFGSAMWMLCAAFLLLMFGQVIVFFTCLSSRKERKQGAVGGEKTGLFGRK